VHINNVINEQYYDHRMEKTCVIYGPNIHSMIQNARNVYYLSSLFSLGLNKKFATQCQATVTSTKATAGNRRVSVSFHIVSAGRKSNSLEHV
jgi:hypothetical protein